MSSNHGALWCQSQDLLRPLFQLPPSTRDFQAFPHVVNTWRVVLSDTEWQGNASKSVCYTTVLRRLSDSFCNSVFRIVLNAVLNNPNRAGAPRNR
jgi:hypothetical protein